jgi:hypothetical protein
LQSKKIVADSVFAEFNKADILLPSFCSSKSSIFFCEPIPTRIICDLINVLRYDSFDANLCIMVNEMIVKDCKKRRT